MTKEIAIQRLDRLMDVVKPEIAEAIEWLINEKKEESGDLISRQAAIDALSFEKEILNRVLDDMDVVGTEREKYSWGLGLIESNIKDIEELPSAQPEQRWIPVSERLPEEPFGCLVTEGT